ncbi:MAG: ABC transporter ATP-binding protein [Dehalococcoidia bacterium]|nr:ABC transporter ATP-binding protein [Dehalococcoidia bacterium]
MSDVIVVEALVKHYGDVRAVDGVSFAVRRGEVFGILGPNGAGKTTALECIEGLTAPTSGRATVLGLDSQRDALKMKEQIGVQLQASAYFNYLKLREILELFGRFYRLRVDADALLAKVGLQEKANTVVNKLSGGQQQRFSIAATLVNDPQVIFLDEPTTGLDPQARHNLWEFIQRIHKEGRTIVLTTHYMEEAQALCDRVAIMDRGRIVALDSPDALVRNLESPYEVRFTVSGAAGATALASLPGVRGVREEGAGAFTLHTADTAETLPALLAWAAHHGARLVKLEVTAATLEDVFLKLTGRALRE